MHGPDDQPLVTIGVLSYNRLHYLRVLLDSARECVRYPNIQWVVVDGGSVEPGLREYLQGLGYLDTLEFVDGPLPDTMNAIVSAARGEYLLMLPDRIQFIVRGDWLGDLVELVRDRPSVGNVVFDAQRRVTLERHFLRGYIPVPGRGHVPLRFIRRPYRRVTTGSGMAFAGYGRTAPGVNTGGTAFCRTEIFRTLGPWRTTMEPQLTNDAGLGAENYLLDIFARSGLKLERYMMQLPVAATIVTDPRGTTAKIRHGNRRYGHYAPPPDGRWYYRICEQADARARHGDRDPSVPFEEIVEPIGFDLPLDETGGLRKVSVIRDDEPYEEIG